MAEQQKWQWQEPGRAWKGVGLYHITLTIPDRQPLLGTLDIPDGDPTMTAVRRTPLGNALVECLLGISNHHPEVQVLHFCLMPDHLHAVLYVRRTMPTGIKGMVRGFWQGVKKLGRASSILPNDIGVNCQDCAAGRVLILSPWPCNVEKRKISREECVALNEMAEEICHQLVNK
jgi:hypothetical protein